MAKSPEEMKAAMIAGLPESTGKPLDAWIDILRSSKLTKHKEFMTLLKTEHGLTHGYANLIALQTLLVNYRYLIGLPNTRFSRFSSSCVGSGDVFSSNSPHMLGVPQAPLPQRWLSFPLFPYR